MWAASARASTRILDDLVKALSAHAASAGLMSPGSALNSNVEVAAFGGRSLGEQSFWYVARCQARVGWWARGAGKTNGFDVCGSEEARPGLCFIAPRPARHPTGDQRRARPDSKSWSTSSPNTASSSSPFRLLRTAIADRERVGEAMPTDSRAERNRADRRGQALTRALSPIEQDWPACFTSGAPVPNGRTLCQTNHSNEKQWPAEPATPTPPYRPRI